MKLDAGTRLGPYEIVAPLGAGGMGEVYRARDTRLDREVAVKVLPGELAASAEMKQRFEREARAVSQLSHPHICAIYDVGSQDGVEYLVMELLDGETLATRLARGPLPLEQVLRYGSDIADALDRAHRAGIVHRDLKPGNVMLTRSGVKLLDFGLAKAFASPSGRGQREGLTSLPTQAGSSPLTQEGTILGTFQYMSPEQLEGKDADARSDIFALGAVLYEMATGRKAFEGKSQASLIAAILTGEPPAVSTIQPMTPPALDRVVRGCLAKDPDDRWQSARDIASELKWIAQGSESGIAAPMIARRKGREKLAWTLAAIAGILAIAAFALVLGRRRESARPVRLSLDLPAKAPFEAFDHVTISPDGRAIAFLAHFANGRSAIWTRSLRSLAAAPLPGTDGASGLFWAPNSASIGFFAESKLKRVEASGGPPQVLADADFPSGGAWSSEGVILFCPKQYSPLMKISATGGPTTPATKLAGHEDSHIWPAFLPDGKHFVFLADASTTPDHSIRLGSLDRVESDVLLAPAVTNLAFAPPDWMLFVRAGVLVAQRLDLRHHRLMSDPVPLGEQVALVDMLHGFDFSASRTGTIVYRSANPDTQLAWFDRAGKRLQNVGEPARYGYIEISPDDRQLAFERLDADLRHGNLWLLDLVRGAASRLTSTASSDYAPIWSPDGRRILFGSARNSSVGDIYEIGAGGAGPEKLVLHGAIDKNPMSWSPDGRFALILMITEATREDIWRLPLDGSGKPQPLVSNRFSEMAAQISPDSRWFAYSSDESGRYEVYVQSFADPSRRYRASTSGGSRPRWRRDGKELFFVAGDMLQSVAIAGGEALEAGPPTPLFRLPALADYAVARDGRILAAVAVDDSLQSSATVVLNWTSELPK